jgi:outer membrane protein OmpA-like peptidoglycan-associated protein
MERRLAEEKRVDVYGIYFGFNSDRIRKESEPILREIADILDRNPDWTLSINGHTDNVGGDAYNLDLSRRRSEAVHKALVERFGIAADRLTTGGHGASAPKDTNDTPEGRARNRRVELVRQ